jgi:hypothetical protein
LVTLSGQQQYTQNGQQASLSGRPTNDSEDSNPIPEDHTNSQSPADDLNLVFTEEVTLQDQRSKKERQRKKWTDDIIPSLVGPYLHLLRQSQSLRHVDRISKHTCTCLNPGRNLVVICVYFDSEPICFETYL